MDAHGVLWALFDSARNARIMPGTNGVDVEFLPLRYLWFQMGRDGNFWLFGIKGTLFGLSGLTNATAVTHFEQRKLTSLGDDSDGNIWVGVEADGIHRVRRKQVSTVSTRDGLPINAVTTVMEDRSGRVWLGTFGKGLFRLENGAVKFQPVQIPNAPNITGLRESRDGTFWVGTYSAKPFRGDGTNFVAGAKGLGCRAIYEDRGGGIWVGTLINGAEHHRDGQLKVYTARDGLANDRVQSLIQEPGGDMWVGTVRGLNRISGGEVIRFAGEEALARQTIRAFHFDERGALWIGTMGGGLGRFYKDRLQLVTSQHGLPSDGVEQILGDDEGNLWLGTWAGIARVSRDDLDACADGRQDFVKAMTLGPEDGMLTAICGSGFQPSCMKSRSGTLWFCTPGGLVIVDPKAVRPSTKAPMVHIEEATADDRSLVLERTGNPPPHVGGYDAVRIPAGVRRVSFRYTGLRYDFGIDWKVMTMSG
jgi:streptogramin lyase